jgi:hypothetical protein
MHLNVTRSYRHIVGLECGLCQEVSMSEPAKLQAWLAEPSASDPMTRLADTNRRAVDFMFGLQTLVFEEIAFVTNEMLDRTRTETHLFAEFASKLAASHSVKDWRAMYGECSQHQLDFIRRDCDRLFRHGERLMEATSRLVNGDRSLG